MSKTVDDKHTEAIIKELKGLVVDVNYSDSISAKKSKKLDKSVLWEKAKKAGKHLNDDSTSSPIPARA